MVYYCRMSTELTTNSFSIETTEERVLEEIGRRLASRRIAFHLTQQALATEAGVSKRTIERIEAGASSQFSNLIRIFRVLDLLPALDIFIPSSAASPMEELRGIQPERKRASAPTSNAPAWEWDDDA